MVNYQGCHKQPTNAENSRIPFCMVNGVIVQFTTEGEGPTSLQPDRSETRLFTMRSLENNLRCKNSDIEEKLMCVPEQVSVTFTNLATMA